MADTVDRARILLAEANQLHGRLLDTILAIQSRALTFLGLVLTFLGIQVSSVAIVISLGTKLNALQGVGLGVSAIAAAAGAAHALAVVRPGDFHDKEFFERETFDRLGRFSEEDMLAQLIADARRWYEHNFREFAPRARLLPRVYWLFVVSIVGYFMFLVVLIFV